MPLDEHFFFMINISWKILSIGIKIEKKKKSKLVLTEKFSGQQITSWH